MTRVGRLLRIVRRGSGSVVTWRRAQMVLLSAQKMPVARIAEVTFTSPDRVRDVIHNFNADGFESLYPKYRGGCLRTFTLPERREINCGYPRKDDLDNARPGTPSPVRVVSAPTSGGI